MEWKPNNNHTQWYVITKSLLFAAQKPLFSANKRHVLQKIELTLKTLSKDENVILKCAFTLNTFCHWMAGVVGIWSTFGLCSMMVPGRINFKVTVIPPTVPVNNNTGFKFPAPFYLEFNTPPTYNKGRIIFIIILFGWMDWFLSDKIIFTKKITNFIAIE